MTSDRTFPTRPDPLGYHHPGTEEELRALVIEARRRGLALRVRGTAHSKPEAIHTDARLRGERAGAIDVVLDRYGAITFDMEKKQVTVQSGCRLARDPRDPWGSADDESGLCAELERRGLALPCLSGIRHQSIAGYLATGSAGGSQRHSIAAQVVALRLVDGLGQVHDVSRERDPDVFFAAGCSMGLLGVISTVTLQCVDRYDVIGDETIRPYEDLAGAEGGDAPAALADFFAREEYARVLWWPQPGVNKLVSWRARRMKESDYGGARGERGALVRRPYVPFPPIAGSTVPAQAAAGAALWLLDRIRAIPGVERVGAGLTNVFVSEPPGGPQQFWDDWWQGLPMDEQMREGYLPVEFTEIWLDAADSAEVIARLSEHYASGGLHASRNFATEIYAGRESPFWMSPGHGRTSIRLNVFWFGGNRGNPEREYFPQYFDLLSDLGFRLHWAKSLFPNPSRGAAYLREQYAHWDDFLKIREQLDPDRIFLTEYWRRQLDIAPRAEGRAALAPVADARPPSDERREQPSGLVFPMKRASADLVGRADVLVEHAAVLDASPEQVFEITASFDGALAWIPLLVRSEFPMGVRLGHGVVVHLVLRGLRLHLRTLVAEPGRRWLVSVDACSIPLSDEVLLETTYTPTPDGRTEIRFRVHVARFGAASPLDRLAAILLEGYLDRVTRGLVAYVAAGRARPSGPSMPPSSGAEVPASD